MARLEWEKANLAEKARKMGTISTQPRLGTEKPDDQRRKRRQSKLRKPWQRSMLTRKSASSGGAASEKAGRRRPRPLSGPEVTYLQYVVACPESGIQPTSPPASLRRQIDDAGGIVAWAGYYLRKAGYSTGRSRAERLDVLLMLSRPMKGQKVLRILDRLHLEGKVNRIGALCIRQDQETIKRWAKDHGVSVELWPLSRASIPKLIQEAHPRRVIFETGQLGRNGAAAAARLGAELMDLDAPDKRNASDRD